jgi:hypothetical protein
MLMRFRRSRNEIDRRLFGSHDRDFDHLRGGLITSSVLGQRIDGMLRLGPLPKQAGPRVGRPKAGGALSRFRNLWRRAGSPSLAGAILGDPDYGVQALKSHIHQCISGRNTPEIHANGSHCMIEDVIIRKTSPVLRAFVKEYAAPCVVYLRAKVVA